MDLDRGEYWVTSPYCYCRGAALFPVSGVAKVPHDTGLGLVPLPGLSRGDTAILAGILMGLAFFLFLLMFILCLLCPWCCSPLCLGWCCGPCCGGGKKKGAAAGWKKSEHLTEVDYKLPRAWLDTFKGIPEDQFDSKIKELEDSKWAAIRDGSRSGGGGAMMRERNVTSGGGHRKAGFTTGGAEDATDEFYFRGESLSRDSRYYTGGDSGIGSAGGSAGSKLVTKVVQSSSTRESSGEATSTALVQKHGDASAAVNTGKLLRLTQDTGSVGNLKKVQVIKETNLRTTTKFDNSGNKETQKTTTTTYTSPAGLGSRLVGFIQGVTGFGGAFGNRRLSIRGRQSGQTRQISSETVNRQMLTSGADRLVSNLAEESQISSNAMQGRQLSLRGSKGRKFMSGIGQGTSTNSSGHYMSIKSNSKGGFSTGGTEMTQFSSGGGLSTMSSGIGGTTNMSTARGGMGMISNTGSSKMSSVSHSGGGGISMISGGGMSGGMVGGTGGMNMMSAGGRGGFSTMSTSVTTDRGDDYLYQREIQREFNIQNPANFLKLYNAYNRYLQTTGVHRF